MRVSLVLGALLLAGCQLGSGDPAAAALVPGTAGGGLAQARAETGAPWLVLDLDLGTATAQALVPDLAANPAYRDRLLVLRRVDSGAGQAGQGGSFARQGDETARTVLWQPFHIAACELTRAQWRRLGGGEPWRAASPAGLAGGGGDDLPATGMSAQQAAAVLAGWARGNGRLALPAGDEWEAAARAGSAATWPWGEERRASQVAGWAVVAETAGGADGPRPVGGRAANALGLHDLVGNVWELTADGAMRGGSWADALALARPANRDLLPPDTGHAAVGLRVVWRP
ncbi:MAG: formylglycine-generating enzyme family protein [Planctomycetes bacterium]|nr:formylglycine-generating enzyme family protein [Planctomycetota bacterium]